MGYPRARLVDFTSPGYYHCISRCVRRGFLCGDQYEHRRQWIEQRLAELLEVFAIDACGYSVMSNHFHMVLKTNPHASRKWGPQEVVRRWVRLFPKGLQRAKQAASTPAEAKRIEKEYLERLATHRDWIVRWRDRLASISWFNKLLKEPIARRANREDGCTGHFWEGRFKSIRLLDKAAVLACMVYVDLNPLRAKMVKALKDSAFTSILQRLKVIRSTTKQKRQGTRATQTSRTTVVLLPTDALFRMTTRDYVSLVATTGGVPIDQRHHSPRLAALGIDSDRWSTTLTKAIRWFGTAVGGEVDLLKEAQRRQAHRVINPLKIYRQ